MSVTATKSGLRAKLRRNRVLYDAYGYWQFMSLRTKAVFLRFEDQLKRRRDGLPVPPPLLRFRVHGAIDRDGFLKVGERCASDIESILASQGLRIADFRNVLDFGCGCGRILRHFIPKADPARFTGTDIDPESIGWAPNLSPAVRWRVNNPLPPTGFRDAEFDFIYGLSVFTHLSEDFQDAWLGELARISRPGAYLLLTVHGTHISQSLPPEEKRRLESDGFLYKVLRTGKLKLDGLPDFYQVAFHTPDYIRKSWSRFFKIVAHVERGIHDHQDAVLMQRN